eukprot:6224472-Pyramimonas_sp.AAC.1
MTELEKCPSVRRAMSRCTLGGATLPRQEEMYPALARHRWSVGRRSREGTGHIPPSSTNQRAV